MSIEEIKAAPKTIQSLLAAEDKEDDFDFPVEALEKANLSLPEAFELELMAAEMLGHLQNYHTSKTALRAARQSGHQRAEEFRKTMEFSRLAVAMIQHQFPDVKGVADRIAEVRARQTKSLRDGAMEKV